MYKEYIRHVGCFPTGPIYTCTSTQVALPPPPSLPTKTSERRQPEPVFFLKVWWQYATLFVYLSYFITYIQSSNHIHTINSPRPENRFQGMNSASLCSLAGRYINPIPTRLLAPIDCLKIPALYCTLSLCQSREYRAGIFKQSMGARNRVGIGLSYRPAWLHRLAEFIPWNRFLGSINV